MHSIKLEIKDNVFDKVIYFLQNLPKNEVTIIEDIEILPNNDEDEKSNLNAYSNHSANTINDWKEHSEDNIWI
ncbi:MAG: hypothetical protein U9O64_11665 [Campylobacterota bacterium]|nr:hypothetical protein [Campylobacterota bacterium]